MIRIEEAEAELSDRGNLSGDMFPVHLNEKHIRSIGDGKRAHIQGVAYPVDGVTITTAKNILFGHFFVTSVHICLSFFLLLKLNFECSYPFYRYLRINCSTCSYIQSCSSRSCCSHPYETRRKTTST